jgi:two-component system, LytTR family, sensor histidine kinase AgrC
MFIIKVTSSRLLYCENYLRQLYYMKNLEELIDRLKSERHDFNHHLGVIYGLLESENPDKAGEYASRHVKTAGEYQNLLDNAVEACLTVGEDSRYIGFNMFYKPDYLIVQTENPVSGASEPQQRRHRTTKSDAENHGYGLRNMEFLAHKHNGFMKTAHENGVFKIDVAVLTEPNLCPGNTFSSL